MLHRRLDVDIGLCGSTSEFGKRLLAVFFEAVFGTFGFVDVLIPTVCSHDILVDDVEHVKDCAVGGCELDCVCFSSRTPEIKREHDNAPVMVPVRRLVLDLLKPYDPDVVTVADTVAGLDGVDGVNIVLVETDKEVQNVKMTVEGDAIGVDAVDETIEDMGAAIHSIDEVVCGERMVEQGKTPQD